jgi:uncharacterized protein (UPF0276 family)
MIKLSVNLSNALIDLVHAGEVQIDGVEAVIYLSPERVLEARAALPGMAFNFHAGRVGLEVSNRADLPRYLALCPDSPFISVHLAPLPMWITGTAMRSQVYLPQPPSEMLVKHFIHKVKRLQAQESLPVILENMAVLRPGKFRFESDPQVITRVLEETSCRMLLDLAHARIAAQERSMPVEDYLLALPLEKVTQVHISGCRERDGVLYDAHQSLQEVDYALLDWVLPRVNPDWLTLEYFTEDRKMVREQVNEIKSIVDGL